MKRGNGEGSIYRTKDGTWRGAIDFGWQDGKHIRKYVAGRTKADVVAKVHALRNQRDRGGLPTDGRLTVEMFMERWLEILPARGLAPTTLENYSIVTRTHIFPTIGKKPLAKLTPADVEALLRAKHEAGLSASTVNRIRALLVQALNMGETWGVVHRNAARPVRGPKLQREEGRSLTVEQARVLLDSVKGHRLEAVFVVMLSLGLRRGEVLGLPWKDIDLAEGWLRITQALPNRAKGQPLAIRDVKTPRSRRTLHLPGPTVEALRAHRRRQAEERLARGPYWTDSGLVFTTTIGTPIDPANFRHTFEKAVKDAGLGHWHPHELRHSAASILLASGVPLEVVSEVLGHVSIKITKDVYGHLIGSQMKDAANAMGAALFGA